MNQTPKGLKNFINNERNLLARANEDPGAGNEGQTLKQDDAEMIHNPVEGVKLVGKPPARTERQSVDEGKQPGHLDGTEQQDRQDDKGFSYTMAVGNGPV